MRIGVDIKIFRIPQSGIPRYVREILTILQKIDTENEYILYEPTPTQFEIFNPKWKKTTIASKLPGTVWLQTRLPKFIRKDKIDVLWCPEQMCPFFRIDGCRIVTTIHDFAFRHYPETLQFTTALILRFFFIRVIHNSTLMVAVSDFTKSEAVKLYPTFPSARIATATCGAPSWSVPFDYSCENRKNNLLFVGNLEPRKNLQNLILALEILKRENMEINLHIVGPRGWKRKKILEIIEKSSIRNQIIFKGFLSESELHDEYLTCKAFVYPSIYEGFGIPVLEALSLDCLVLTSKGTVMQEIAKECAIYFDPMNPSDIADKIRSIYMDSFDRNAFLKEKDYILKKHSWMNAASDLLKAFKLAASEIRE